MLYLPPGFRIPDYKHKIQSQKLTCFFLSPTPFFFYPFPPFPYLFFFLISLPSSYFSPFYLSLTSLHPSHMCSISLLSTFCTFFPLLPSNTCFLSPVPTFLSFALSPQTLRNFLCQTPLILPVVSRFFDSFPSFLLACVFVPFTQFYILSPSSLCFLLFLLHSSLPSICLQTLPLSFPLSLSAYSSYTLSSLCNLAFPSSLLVPLSTSPCSFHPQISAPYINTLSIMLSNIIILLPEITSLLSLSYSPNTSHCLFCFPQYLSDICRICGSFIECVTQNPRMYLFYFPFFPVPLIFFTLPLSFIKHHHFRLLNIHFLLLLPHILSQVLHHFFPFSCTLANARLQTFSLPTTLPPAYTFFNSSSISATYIVNSRGLSEQPCLTPFVASNHSPSCSP
jgi:hypothetical protein